MSTLNGMTVADGPRFPQAVVRADLAGALFMVAAGSALHFVYDWTGGWRPVGLVAAVNESIWEHLKLAFWPGVAVACIQIWILSLPWSRLAAVKGVSLFITAVSIVGIFSSYTAILGHNVLWLDIGTFVLAILIGQAVSAFLLIRNIGGWPLLRIGQVLMILQLAAFATFTWYPPDHWLFVDSRTGLLGVPLN